MRTVFFISHFLLASAKKRLYAVHSVCDAVLGAGGIANWSRYARDDMLRNSLVKEMPNENSPDLKTVSNSLTWTKNQILSWHLICPNQLFDFAIYKILVIFYFFQILFCSVLFLSLFILWDERINHKTNHTLLLLLRLY